MATIPDRLWRLSIDTLPKLTIADRIHARGILTYTAMYDLIREAIDRLIMGLPADDWAFDPVSLISGLDNILRDWEPLLGRTLSDTIIAAYMAGASEVARSVPIPYLRSHGWTAPVLPPPHEPIFPMIFAGEPEPLVTFPIIEQAARHLSRKRLMERWQFDALAGEARRNAFSVAGVTRLKTLDGIRETLVESVQRGQTFQEWRKRVPEVVEWTALSPAHQETVWRTNIQSSLSQGKDAVLDHPFIINLFPYEELVVIGDERLCPICGAAAMAGLTDKDGNPTGIFRRNDAVWRNLLKPPLHWSCRCSSLAMTAFMAAERGIPEAIEWERTGQTPLVPAHVVWPDIQLPSGWRTAA